MVQIPPKTRSDLGWGQLLEELAGRCQTERGAQRARAIDGFERREDALGRLEVVLQCRSAREENTRLSLDGVTDLRPVLSRVDKGGVLTPEDLLAVAATLRAAYGLRRQGRSLAESRPALGELLRGVNALSDVRAAIDDCFDDSGDLADHASSELAHLRDRVRNLRDEAIGRLKGMMADPVMQHRLQDDYFTDRDGRYVLPVKAELRHEVKGIVLGSSASGATVFMEPEAVIDVNNRIKLAAAELEREVRRILADLSSLVHQERSELVSTLERLALIDVVGACARLAQDLGCGDVGFSDHGQLELVGLRHPLMVLAGTEVVSNDVRLTPGSTLVVTGPNTGGKTVLIKTVGLCALMVRAGLVPSCTGESRIPFFDVVLTDMGDDQSITRSLSTFSAHMTNVGRLLDRASSGALVLLDEVAVGTDPVQGAALARAIVEALADREAMVLVTTHYAQLKELPAKDPRFINASMGFDLEHIRPTYEMIPNAPGSSSALSVARRLGLPAELLERAAGLLDPAAVKLDRLLEQLEVDRRSLSAQLRDLESERTSLARRKTELDQAERAVQEERKAFRKRGYDEAVTALRGARDELDRSRKRLRKACREKDLAAEEREINRRAGDVAHHAPPPDAPPSRPAKEVDLAVGTEVWVAQLGGLARVVSVDRAGVSVQAGALKLRVSPDQVRIPNVQSGGKSAGTPAHKAAYKPPGHVPTGTQDAQELNHFREPQTTCDLRGLRVDEAEEQLARFLDRMVLEEASSVLIIHGHGTGALRKMVRQQLRGTTSLDQIRGGRRGEGGDGVTVAFFQS
jgi:DNA mismatch repair protein MutS2